MKNKMFWFTLLVVLVIAAFSVVSVSAQEACDPLTDLTCPVEPAPAPTGIVLPSYVELLLAAGVGFLVTNGLKSLGLNVGGYAAQITAGIVTGLVAFVNSLLALVPEAAQEPVGVVFLLLASILSAYGIHYSVKPKV